MTITIGEGMTLPDEIVTETTAFLAKRGMGKSNGAVVMAEQMWDAGFQWVAIDPKGDWWGIRSSANGKGEGLPVLLVGGRHGDLPLSETDGALMARLIVERNWTVILDVSLFSKGEQIRFVTDFAEALFRAMADSPRPLHLFLEEAEEFLPQRVTATTARMVGAYSKIAKQGRTSGLGVTLITQRSASLNKDALSQTDTLILFRTPSPHDRKAVIAWAEHADEVKDIAASLGSLEKGESWLLSPGFLGRNVRFQWARRRTFDSGATPVTGEKRPEPTSLAQIDLAEVKEMMADTVEKAKADDPKTLKARIAELEREIRDLGLQPAQTVDVVHEVIPESVVKAARLMVDQLDRIGQGMHDFLAACEDQDRRSGTAEDVGHPTPSDVVPKPERQPARQGSRPTPPSPGTVSAKSREGKILNVLATHRAGLSDAQIAILTGYSPASSTIGAGLSNLRKAGYIVDQPGEPRLITDAGLAAIGEVEPLPTGQALIAYWLNKAGGARERAFLALLIEVWPLSLTQDEIAARTDYSAASSTIGAGMSRLRALGLVKGWALHPEFAAAIGKGK